MKILKINVPNGFLMLKPGFSLNFLTKTRVDKDAINEDLFELEEDFYLPKETAFIGKNSSGKTTVLRLINLAISLLKYGRVRNFVIPKDKFKIEVIFYSKGKIYSYNGEFGAPKAGSYYLAIENETLRVTTKKDYYNKELSNASYQKINGFTPNIGLDTSFVTKYTETENDFSQFLNSIETYDEAFELFCLALEKETMTSILRLFDDSVEYITLPVGDDGEPLKNNTFNFKRIGDVERTLEASALRSQLSDGTIRGVKLYATAIIAFTLGGTIIIDEIERNFNKNLIFNLIDMFNDEEINKAGATLIYSTHYAEILDNSNRCDNINVMHRVGNEISIKNMCTDYNLRTELKKSDQFDQNAFDNLINYDALMTLKRCLRK